MQQGDLGEVVVDVVVSRAVSRDGSVPSTSVGAPFAVTPRRPGERITVLTLSWSREDPMAVHLKVSSSPDHPALPRGTWVVLRDFLRAGLDEPTGDGAVRIAPDPGSERVLLRLARAGRPAWISAPRSVVSGFLEQTDAQDPTGEQRSAEAVDAVITSLLDR